MATIKDAIIINLGLSQTAAGLLDSEMDRHITTARSELIRVGASPDIAASNHPLVNEAIITYTLMKMDAKENYEMYKEAWMYQIDNIRKSTLTVSEEEPVED